MKLFVSIFLTPSIQIKQDTKKVDLNRETQTNTNCVSHCQRSLWGHSNKAQSETVPVTYIIWPNMNINLFILIDAFGVFTTHLIVLHSFVQSSNRSTGSCFSCLVPISSSQTSCSLTVIDIFLLYPILIRFRTLMINHARIQWRSLLNGLFHSECNC